MPDDHDAAAAPFSASNGPVGVLVLHGLTATVASVRPLADALADAGLSVEAPLLPGHGTSVADLAEQDFADFYDAAQFALLDLQARCEAVVVAGLSMGGTLAASLARRHRLEGLVLVNPLVHPPAPSLVELLESALASGHELIPSIGADVAREGVEDDTYDATPIKTMLSLFAASVELAAHLDEITCPVLLLTSRHDHVVPGESGDLVEAEVAGPVERVWLEDSFHVATLDNDAAELEARVVEFVTKVALR